MNTNISCILKACDRLNIQYQILHNAGNLVQINIKDCCYLFVNWSTPLNTQAEANLCKDKDFSYALLKDCIRVPKTKGFLSPYASRYQQYLQYRTIEDILKDIELNFFYPIIVKKKYRKWRN